MVHGRLSELKYLVNNFLNNAVCSSKDYTMGLSAFKSRSKVKVRVQGHGPVFITINMKNNPDSRLRLVLAVKF